jgi:hypothetical protein
MSEAIEITNLVLGIVGTITGSIAIIIHYWRLRRENPRLEISVLSCEHSFTISKSNVKTVSFWVEFQAKNLGDRGTTLNDVGLNSDKLGKGQFRKQYWRLGEQYVPDDKMWINAHETRDIGADFVAIEFPSEDKEQIDCIFTIYHTHGAKTVQCISNTRRESVRET